jgi:multicomponent Na+:H+ antiporter subunit A
MGMSVGVFSGFLLALAAPGLYRLTGRAAGWTLALLPLALTVYFAGFVGAVASGEVFHARHDWVPALGVKSTPEATSPGTPSSAGCTLSS